jgi:hypothetical protein
VPTVYQAVAVDNLEVHPAEIIVVMHLELAAVLDI